MLSNLPLSISTRILYIKVATGFVDQYTIALIQNFIIEKPLDLICTLRLFYKASKIEVFFRTQGIRTNFVDETMDVNGGG